ncbi:hypothetical protein QN277_005324 [Acacia crassicarpa]|uniref:Vesicle transport protein n=1 Tax=Acacia crassicarpa TaxID=499986 RepID=A0AAE1IZA7_9FABA|nr:hypothetical protein QN277_005324 [Acacia crassicarpa]
MQKMAQGWFSQATDVDNSQKPLSSLLADWNSYAASQPRQENSDSSFGFDIKSAVRSAIDTVMGTFSMVSKGVRDIPGNFQSATSNVPSEKALLYFGLLLATGVFLLFIAFTLFLPVMVVVPQKFAICFTLGCGFIIGLFFILKGPKNQLAHMTSEERLPFTLGFIGSEERLHLIEKSCTHLVRIPGNIPVDLIASELDGETTGLNNGEISVFCCEYSVSKPT